MLPSYGTYLRALSVGCALSLGVPMLQAQEDAAAEALFNRGLSDMKEGKYETACPALAESYRLDPRPGTLFTSAECEVKANKLATAWVRYGEFLQFVNRMPDAQAQKMKKRRLIAEEQRKVLVSQIPELTLVLPRDAPSRVVVTRDGVVVGKPSLGVAIPVDPGLHVITTRVDDNPAEEQQITIKAGDKPSLTLVIRPVAAALLPSPPPAAARGNAPSDVSPGPSSSRRVLTYTAFGLGGAGVIAGSITGWLVLRKKTDIDANCVDKLCNETGKQSADSAKSLGTLSNIGFLVGLAGVATGVVLLLTEPTASSPVKTVEARSWVPSVNYQGGNNFSVELRTAW